MRKLLFSCFISLFLLSGTRVMAEEIDLDIVEDSYIDSIQFYDFQGSSGRLLLGFGDTTGNGITKIFLKYSIDELTARGITPDKIESATLRMYQYRNKYGTDYNIKVAEPDLSWDENVLSWISNPPLRGEEPGVQEITSALDWKEIDVTSLLVRQLWDSPNSFGIVLMMEDEFQSGGSFWSTNCSHPNIPPVCPQALYPHIVVTLKEDAKLELVKPLSQEVITKNETVLEWNFNKEDELYKVEVSDDSNFTDILITSNWISDKYFNINSLKNGKYYWRVTSYFSEIQSTVRSFQVDVVEPKQEEKIDKDNIAHLKEVEQIKEEVKGVSSTAQKQPDLGYCKFKYNISNKTVSKTRCKLDPPKVPRIDHLLSKDDIYWLDVEVQIPTRYDIFIEYTQCRKWSLFDPSSWFGCSEKAIRTERKTVSVRGSIWALVQGKKIDGYKSTVSAGRYKISFPLADDMSSKKFAIRYDTSYIEEIDENVWVDVFEFSPKSNSATIPKIEKRDTKPYRFPFDDTVGVTQWYGDTEYQHPHTGIDFGAKLKPVYSVADGKVVYAGWDNGKNKCLSGGNYILIEHKDGRHTMYLHLKDFINEKGKKWKAGDKIYKGQKVGTTGNTGLYNCESLGYHLHFETRTSKSYLTHTDPVPLINTDWNKIPTLGYGSYPGRLSGQNPHPGK